MCPTSASLVFYYHACVLIAQECIRPLLPVLLSAFGAGGVISGAHASRLQRLISAMAGGGVAQLSVGVGGSLLRAYCGTNARDAAGRAGILKSLALLTSRAPGALKLLATQLQGTCFRGLADPDAEVQREAAAALHALLPILSRTDGLLASYTGLFRTAAGLACSLTHSLTLVSLRRTLVFLQEAQALHLPGNSLLQSRADELRSTLAYLAHGMEGGDADVLHECAALLAQSAESQASAPV